MLTISPIIIEYVMHTNLAYCFHINWVFSVIAYSISINTVKTSISLVITKYVMHINIFYCFYIN